MRPPPGPRDLQGRAIGGLAVAVDITARKQAEVALRRTADELRYKNEELSRLTDVLRTVNLTPETRVAERTSELTLRTNQLQGLAVQLVRAKQDKRRRIAQVIHDHLQPT
ncbi:MAG: hypothetical protein M1608_09800, partial [Candidatus Omnitrophica bacterium]|nr:hypothetical protein [Candidatus Omnitrophota bacterium]